VESIETKQKLRESHLGCKHTEETKRKISETNKKHTGWTHSEETKKKMSISAKMRWVNKKPSQLSSLEEVL